MFGLAGAVFSPCVSTLKSDGTGTFLSCDATVVTDRDAKERRVYRDTVIAHDDAAERGDGFWDWRHRRHDAFRCNAFRVDGRGEPG